MAICLQQDADCLHMVHLMPLHPKTPSTLASFKSRLVLPFWYQLTQVVQEKRPLNRCSSSSLQFTTDKNTLKSDKLLFFSSIFDPDVANEDGAFDGESAVLETAPLPPVQPQNIHYNIITIIIIYNCKQKCVCVNAHTQK